MAALGQTERNLGQVLPGRHHVRVEGLVEEEEGQNQKLKAETRKAESRKQRATS
jgi:hypothetical protein